MRRFVHPLLFRITKNDNMKTLLICAIFAFVPQLIAAPLIVWSMGWKMLSDVSWGLGTVLCCATLGCFVTAKIADYFLG